MFKWCHNSLSKHEVLNSLLPKNILVFKIAEESENILVYQPHTNTYNINYIPMSALTRGRSLAEGRHEMRGREGVPSGGRSWIGQGNERCPGVPDRM